MGGALDYRESLGILGQMAKTAALFEPFRNPVTISDVCSCLNKSLEVRAELERRARRESLAIEETEIPYLWIL
jgi:hypothetical protein